MCGRYYIDTDDLEYERVLEALAVLPKAGEIFPADTAPALTSAGLSLMRWGFPRCDGKGVLINARAETAPVKPMFAGPFAGFRCLLPASFYFEWKNEGTRKIKHRMFLSGARLIWLAGLARNDGDGAPRFVILTRPAAEGIVRVHERMPLILPEGAHRAWLSGSKNEAVAAMEAAETEVEAEPTYIKTSGRSGSVI